MPRQGQGKGQYTGRTNDFLVWLAFAEATYSGEFAITFERRSNRDERSIGRIDTDRSKVHLLNEGNISETFEGLLSKTFSAERAQELRNFKELWKSLSEEVFPAFKLVEKKGSDSE